MSYEFTTMGGQPQVTETSTHPVIFHSQGPFGPVDVTVLLISIFLAKTLTEIRIAKNVKKYLMVINSLS